MKKAISQSILSLLIYVIISCETSNTSEISIVGKWLSTTSETLCEDNRRDFINDNISDNELQFYSNGTVGNTIINKRTQKKTVFSGHYSRKGEMLIMAYDNSATDTFKIITIESNKMVLKTAKIGYPCSTTMPFSKQ